MKKRFILYLLLLVTLLGYYAINSLIMASESSITQEVISFNEDIIGNITIVDKLETRRLLQGFDNNYYLTHDYNKNESMLGEVFLDYEGDLKGKNNQYIYLNKDLLIDEIKINDIVKIMYLNKRYEYIVKRIINNNIKSDSLVIKLIENNKVIKSIECVS